MKQVGPYFMFLEALEMFWEMLQRFPARGCLIAYLNDSSLQNDRKLAESTCLSKTTANYAYIKLSIDTKGWFKVYGRKPIQWWQHVFDIGWCSHLPFHAKVVIWRIIIGGLP